MTDIEYLYATNDLTLELGSIEGGVHTSVPIGIAPPFSAEPFILPANVSVSYVIPKSSRMGRFITAVNSGPRAVQIFWVKQDRAARKRKHVRFLQGRS